MGGFVSRSNKQFLIKTIGGIIVMIKMFVNAEKRNNRMLLESLGFRLQFIESMSPERQHDLVEEILGLENKHECNCKGKCKGEDKFMTSKIYNKTLSEFQFEIPQPISDMFMFDIETIVSIKDKFYKTYKTLDNVPTEELEQWILKFRTKAVVRTAYTDQVKLLKYREKLEAIFYLMMEHAHLGREKIDMER